MARSAIDVDEWVTRHPIAFIVIVAGIVALLAFSFHSEWFNPTPQLESSEWAWWAVEGTQEFIVDRVDLIPPIVRDGKVLVRAYFFGCGDCDEANRFVAYYVKYSDEAKAELEQLKTELEHQGRWPVRPDSEDDPPPASGSSGRFISIDTRTWHASESDEARRMLDGAFANCPSRRFVQCHPESPQGWGQ